jgi:hypothetical protein
MQAIKQHSIPLHGHSIVAVKTEERLKSYCQHTNTHLRNINTETKFFNTNHNCGLLPAAGRINSAHTRGDHICCLMRFVLNKDRNAKKKKKKKMASAK